MKDYVACGLMLAGAFGLWMASGIHREAPLVGYDKANNCIATLENQVAQSPTNAQALLDLGHTYLDKGSPGLALAAIERAPAGVQSQPTVSHLWARVLLHEGKSSLALAKERETIESCVRESCPAWLEAAAQHHADFLNAMVALGVEDYRVDPSATASAYQRMASPTVAMLDVDPQSTIRN